MRTAIWAAILAATPVFCNPTPQDAAGAPATQQETARVEVAATEASKVVAPGIPASPTAIDNTRYVLGPDDQISVKVWGDERLSGLFLVRPDGLISVNLVGEVLVSGKTPEQLGKELEDLLKKKDILARPNVTVNVTSVQSKKYMLNGEVNKPGSVPLTTPTTVMEALVNAGGFRDFADKKHIQIIRGTQRFSFNWNEVIKGKNLKQNILLEPGDIIIVK